MKKQRTKDEKFIIAVYETALQTGDLHCGVNRYQAGQAIGIHPKGVDTICNLLLQANFVTKGTLDDICLTQNGCRLVEQLLKI